MVLFHGECRNSQPNCKFRTDCSELKREMMLPIPTPGNSMFRVVRRERSQEVAGFRSMLNGVILDKVKVSNLSKLEMMAVKSSGWPVQFSTASFLTDENPRPIS